MQPLTERASRAAWFAAAGVVDDGSAEAWARAYVLASTPAAKLAPPPRPRLASEPVTCHAAPLAPGRGPEFTVQGRTEGAPRRGALARREERARLVHLFLHHEVQAAELMAHAVLRFPGTPTRFRRGLFGVLDDELRHANLYAARLAELGASYGALPVRDWFWQRVPSAPTPQAFAALMGMGFEAGNLEHTRRFEQALAEAGDSASAALVASVGDEEVAHVRFATRWFQRFAGEAPHASPDFEAWRATLPAPLTPTVLRGVPLDRERRGRAGQGPSFLDALEAW